MDRIHGIVPPMTTPFGPDGEIDEAAFRNDVRYLVETGVHGLAVGGSTGEGHTLSFDELRRMAGIAVEEARGRIPIIIGVIADSTRQVIDRAKAVADLGVAALQVTPVHYLFKPDDESMLGYFADITQASGLPILIYNVIP